MPRAHARRYLGALSHQAAADKQLTQAELTQSAGERRNSSTIKMCLLHNSIHVLFIYFFSRVPLWQLGKTFSQLSCSKIPEMEKIAVRLTAAATLQPRSHTSPGGCRDIGVQPRLFFSNLIKSPHTVAENFSLHPFGEENVLSG